jgi:hypothetical protein
VIRELIAAARDQRRLMHLSVRQLAGRKFYLAPLLPLLWSAAIAFALLVGWDTSGYTASNAQGSLIGLPLTILAVLLGVRIISGEVDRRTLEIAYTVPGGAHRVWLSKLGAAWAILVVALALLAAVTWLFFTEYPWGALYGALQAATFYLVLSMTLSAVFRSEATGALVTAVILILNGVLTGFGEALRVTRVSPFFNPGYLEQRGTDAADLLAWTVQNRVGFALAIAAIVALGFARAERREKMLGS